MPMFAQPATFFSPPSTNKVTAPLGGDVNQNLNPWANWFSSGWGQYGLLNINLGLSSAPDVEREVLDGVASYGKQLGRIGDVMAVLLRHFNPQAPLSKEEEDAIIKLRAMLIEIKEIKEQHGRRAIAP